MDLLQMVNKASLFRAQAATVREARIITVADWLIAWHHVGVAFR